MTLDPTNLIATACTLICGWLFQKSRDASARAAELEQKVEKANMDLARLDAAMNERRLEQDSIKNQLNSIQRDLKTLAPLPTLLQDLKADFTLFRSARGNRGAL